MTKLVLPGLLILIAATSCVPARIERPVTSQEIRPERDPRALLRKLALDVPDDVAALPDRLPRAGDAAETFAAPAFLAAARSDDDATRASDCLTAAIYYEARSEPIDGQRAVAQVVLNRVRDRAFPASVCGVVYQGSNRRTGCQFSFTCDGSMNHPRDWRSWMESRAVADSALAGSVYTPVGSATHYHTTAITAWWASSLARIGIVGSHIFYRWRGAMERALAFRQQYAGWEPIVGGGGGDYQPSVGTDRSVAGVTIHYGAGSQGGVVVHRDGTAPGPIMPIAVAARMTTTSGVRVHRNMRMPDAELSSTSDGATFAEDAGAL